jgi:sugar lactone lactonase YvrE
MSHTRIAAVLLFCGCEGATPAGPVASALSSALAGSAQLGQRRGGWQKPHRSSPSIRARQFSWSAAGPAAGLDRTITTTVGFDQHVPGPIANAWMGQPRGLFVNAAGDVFYADSAYEIVQRVDHATGIVTRVAGGGLLNCPDAVWCTPLPTDDGLPATQASFASLGITGGDPITMDGRGILYVADSFHNRIAAVNTNPPGSGAIEVCGVSIAAGTLETLVQGLPNFQGGATSFPVDVALDPLDQSGVGSPDVIFSELFGNGDVYGPAVRRIDCNPSSPTYMQLSMIAGGTSTPWYACPVGAPQNGDGGLAVDASLCAPEGIAFDPAHNLYFAEWNNIFQPTEAGEVRKVDRHGNASWDGATISTYAGDGFSTTVVENVPATESGIAARPGNIAFDAAGNGFFSDQGNSVIRRIDAVTGIINTVAGETIGLYSAGDIGGPALTAAFAGPDAIFFAGDGRLYIADSNNEVIRWVDPDPEDGLIKGRPTEKLGELGSTAGLKNPFFGAFDSSDRLFVNDVGTRIRRIEPDGTVITVVNGRDIPGESGDGGRAIDARISGAGIAFDEKGNLYLVEASSGNIRRVDAAPGPDGRPQVTPDSTIHFVVNTTFVPDPNDIPGGQVYSFSPGGIAFHEKKIFLGELFGLRVWSYDLATKQFTLVAGNGNLGPSGDGGPAKLASFNAVVELLYDRFRDALYIVDIPFSIRKVDLKTGIISSVVQFPDLCPPYGCFGSPLYIAMAGSDFLFVNDDAFQVVYRADLSAPNPTPQVVAGFFIFDGPPGFSGDEVLGPQARLAGPEGLAVDSAGKLHIVEASNQRVRRLGLTDILPGRFPNVIPAGSAPIRVAIESTYDFDATTLDPATLTVAGAPALPNSVRFEDVDGDGRVDLVFSVSADQMRLTASDKEALVLGSTFAGKSFQDADWVTVVGRSR